MGLFLASHSDLWGTLPLPGCKESKRPDLRRVASMLLSFTAPEVIFRAVIPYLHIRAVFFAVLPHNVCSCSVRQRLCTGKHKFQHALSAFTRRFEVHLVFHSRLGDVLHVSCARTGKTGRPRKASGSRSTKFRRYFRASALCANHTHRTHPVGGG